MEVRDDHFARLNEVSGERQPENIFLGVSSNGTQASGSQITQNGFQKSGNPFLHPPQSTGNGFVPTNPFFTRAKDSNGNDKYQGLLLRNGQSNGFPHFSTPSFEDDWPVYTPLNLRQDTTPMLFPSLPSQNAFPDSFCARISPARTSDQNSSMFEPFKEEASVSGRTENAERDYLLEYILANQKNDVESLSSRSESNHAPLFGDSPAFFPSPGDTEDLFTSISASRSSERLSGNSAGPFQAQESHSGKPFMAAGRSEGLPPELSTLPPLLNTHTDVGLMFRRRPPKPTPRVKAQKNPLKAQNINNDVFFTSNEFVPTEKPAQTPPPAPPTSKLDMAKSKTDIQNINQDAFFTSPEFVPAQTTFKSTLAPPTSKLAVPNPKTNIRDETDASTHSQVYEDVLFIGQEKCVEDWPEDSPEFSPDWKPSGKLKLRRESLRIAAESEADVLGRKSGKTKLRLGVSRRKSKDKTGEDARVLQTDTLYESEEKHPDMLNVAYGGDTWGTKAQDDVFPPEHDHNDNTKSKSMKTKKTKFTVPHLQYKGSKKKSFPSHSDVFENESPSPHDAKDFIADDLKKMNSLSFSEENVSSRAEKEKWRFSADSWGLNNAEKGGDLFKAGDVADDLSMDKHKMKKSLTFKVPRVSRKGSKSALENDLPQKGADLFKASDAKGSELNASEDYTQGLNNAEKGADLFKAGDLADDLWMDKHTMDTKTEKAKKEIPPRSESKAKDQMFFTEDTEPPGATSGDYYLSEAAKAEWMSSQMDLRRVKAPDEVDQLEGVKEEEEGDTDSLMEWWNTVELWDELPSDDESSAKEDETKSFTEIADKVHHGLRVFYKVFTEQAEVLYLHVLRLYSIGDDLSNFHRRAKIANITGGTTTAVGGAAVITGLALAPVTLGASLIVSAVGLGVAAAGGITAASATLSDNVHEMSDRKKIEVVLQDYEARLVELRRCLRFVAEGVRRMRFHPLLRRNNYYAGDWEVRRALQTISLVGDPVEQAEENVEKSTAALNSVYKGMDKFFSKDSKEMKKGCKKEVTMQVNMLAKLLHENLVALNTIRENLMEATGHV